MIRLGEIIQDTVERKMHDPALIGRELDSVSGTGPAETGPMHPIRFRTALSPVDNASLRFVDS
ncbi:hypothetical protein A4U64_20245 [Rhodococcus sp. WB1]|nr:hypothetical protein A4U64_20245 [Rhodococcus sp. WB1]PND51180.1 hypothetical protein CQZ88_15850 [Rhodococcus sp. ENV425]